MGGCDVIMIISFGQRMNVIVIKKATPTRDKAIRKKNMIEKLQKNSNKRTAQKSYNINSTLKN